MFYDFASKYFEWVQCAGFIIVVPFLSVNKPYVTAFTTINSWSSHFGFGHQLLRTL